MQHLFLSAIVLAAGQSRRMGNRNKLLLPLGRHTLIEHVLSTLQALKPDELIVVTGHDAPRITPLAVARGAQAVYNPDYPTGLASSIVTGIRHASPQATSFLLCPADLPLLKRQTLHELLEHWHTRNPGMHILRPYWQNRPGHPVLIDHTLRKALLELRGTRGAQTLFNEHASHLQRVSVADPGICLDIDTPEDYVRYLKITCTSPTERNLA